MGTPGLAFGIIIFIVIGLLIFAIPVGVIVLVVHILNKDSKVAPQVNAAGLPVDVQPLNNSSGQNAGVPIPSEIRGWNWGAFFLNWIWGIGNNTFIALLMFIPFVNFIMLFVLGAKGNEWAWKNKHWDSIEQFKRVQKKWAWAGLIIFLVVTAFMIITMTTAGIFVAKDVGGGVQAADTFLMDLSSGNTQAAYDSMANSEKATFALTDLQAAVKTYPYLAQVTSESFSDQTYTGTTALLSGTITTDDGSTYPITINEVNENGHWKVFSFQLTEAQTDNGD